MSIFEYLTTFTISSKACILPFTWNISSSKKKKTFINHKINILPHMYVIFHDLKNNLQLVSPHFFLSVKKNKIYLPSPESTSSDLSLSLSLSNHFSTLHRHCVHTRVHRERLREISIRIAGVKKQKRLVSKNWRRNPRLISSAGKREPRLRKKEKT